MVDPDHISIILNMKLPTCVKEVQTLNGHLADLKRFISQPTDKCRPFFQALKKNGADFCWNEECKTSFQGLKRYLSSPPLLSKYSSGETLFLYLANSKSAVSMAVFRKIKKSRSQCIMPATP